MKYKLAVAILFFSITRISYAQQSDTLNRYDSNGLKTGKWIYHWKETGKTASMEYYIKGKRDGLCLFYDINGRLQNEIEYQNDTMHGIYKFYSPTGQKEVAEFKRGRREGITKYYNYKGQLVEDYEYHNNMPNGFHRIYSESGRIIVETTYINGSENGTRRSYKDNDKKELILETDFINDSRIETRYYKNGKLLKTVKEPKPIPQNSLDG